MANCTACGLSKTRSNTVFGSGDPGSPLVFIGEGPGAQEDLSGMPFVGRSGQLLDRLLEEELGVDRSQLYITNIVKCRPPENRNPSKAEIDACTPHLVGQLDLLGHRLIIALGSVAMSYLLEKPLQITKVRGTFFETRFGTTMPMYHPSYGLRSGAVTISAMRADLVSAKLYLRELGYWKW